MNRFARKLALTLLGLGLAGLGTAPPAHADQPAAAYPERYARRWVYVMLNLQVNENAEKLISLIERAAGDGYNGVVLADYKLNILDRVPEHYFANVRRVKAAAQAKGVELIPALFPIGYSNGLLAHDPNLAEGLEAHSVFIARGRRAEHAPDPATRYRNGGLEEVRDNGGFAGLSFQDDPGQATVADTAVCHSGQTSCRFRDTHTTSTGGNARLVQQVSVRPRTCYRFSAWVKTDKLQAPGGFRLLALGSEGGQALTFFEGGIQPDQDWTQVDVVFNSLDQTSVNLYVGLWGGSAGTLWVDDLELTEVPLTNVLRRPGCPLTVRSADGKRTYEEGRDFEPIADPKLGQVPYAGEYSFAHDGPALTLTPQSRIQVGERLEVTWYHPVLVHGSQIACCLSEPKVYEILEAQARRVIDLLEPRTLFLSHDELRVANWCAACQARNLTAGQLLADNVSRCARIAHSIDPKLDLVVWSDMFDPHHNAVADYYLVRGSLAGSWEGLPRSMLIANWNSGQAGNSLAFFAGRGHRQVLAGYYDAPALEGFSTWDQAARGVPGVVGFMYTTWQARFEALGRYAEALRTAR